MKSADLSRGAPIKNTYFRSGNGWLLSLGCHKYSILIEATFTFVRTCTKSIEHFSADPVAYPCAEPESSFGWGTCHALCLHTGLFVTLQAACDGQTILAPTDHIPHVLSINTAPGATWIRDRAIVLRFRVVLSLQWPEDRKICFCGRHEKVTLG